MNTASENIVKSCEAKSLRSRVNISNILNKEIISNDDFAVLLSKNLSDSQLEEMAQKAHEITLRNFGKVVNLYAPLYLANFCDNECLYCGFKRANSIERKKLSLSEVQKEAEEIANYGIRQILILTGESRKETPVSYIKECIILLKKYFTSISIEVYPLEGDEYAELIEAGVDGLTIYQETYDKELYKELHPSGPKSDFAYRFDAPERACSVKVRSLNIGALLGLADFRREVLSLGLHAKYLEDKYPKTDIGVSLPRFQPAVSDFSPKFIVTDRDLVQAITALRLFLPRAGINISTRENFELRSHLVGLGVTRMSAGSKTEVGGYGLKDKTEGQFEIADKSSVEEVKEMICAKGYQPVFKDWQQI